MADMQITVGLRRKTGMHRIVNALRQIFIYDLFNKISGNRLLFRDAFRSFAFHHLFIAHHSLRRSCRQRLYLLIFPDKSVNLFYYTIFFLIIPSVLMADYIFCLELFPSERFVEIEALKHGDIHL